MKIDWSSLWKKEDWWANWVGFFLFALCISGIVGIIYEVPKFKIWTANPLDSIPAGMLLQLLILVVGLTILYTIAIRTMKESAARFIPAFIVVFLIVCVSFIISNQATVKAWGLAYPLWAVLIGLVIANTVGVPNWLKPGAKTELYIKTGLVLLGAEILFGRILKLGPAGLAIAWGVTPFVLLFMYYYGTRVLKIDRALVLVLSAGTSICGISAAVASAAACKARKEYLTLTIAIILIFTVFLMFALPAFCRLVGLSEIMAGGWIGGTVESTGAVVAAGELVGPKAMEVAVVIKMIQNVLIGIFAFIIAAVWVVKLERDPTAPRPGLGEIWFRSPKFIIGFLALSLISSFVLMPILGDAGVATIVSGSKALRGFFFSLAFVSIGLESNFRELAKSMAGGKPLILYFMGLAFNLLLTFFIVWLTLSGVLFPMPI